MTVNVTDPKPSNFNLPNALTAVRIIFIPVFAWLVLKADGHQTSWMWWSFVCFILMMFTDKLDGDIARARGIVTDFGKIADPIADKALMITALVCLNLVGLLPWWITTVIVVRELGITFWRMAELRRGRVVPASKGGKFKTALQTCAIALYLVPVPSFMAILQLIVMLVATLVTVVTGIQYLIDARRVNA
ncbi:phosphatidylglycerophosphate synthase [Corynebacterium kutscheri]|uniref:CDP-diacylglycerol--glycerol-3-phosphate 3-phosphatidyltransferase n=1 Tax=Corynebacterium kutscheri TaxID=35755 RepID=A0A0F6TDN4_9CORY|nr:CDP-diacylglycerol--glycerol-3-phosphate 3-phosphatidyltransferase [Corynebacterium kutscheri]AKE41421.1 CDP-diacylglycerol--glycerol-3-phosphate 3-phosphatidyltransferase [Corynebacterium kutscheri]VEH08698.1 phosphatidylglycerophosphate synthase [Corynebacterium kutscheri]VEH09745.1 phosphatidylglycerophosphate synthase [Corynebacterium kutscheri]VEH79828.1 phosphatidylglycerophosphate synthase [Corynebacterium kutscheri]